MSKLDCPKNSGGDSSLFSSKFDRINFPNRNFAGASNAKYCKNI